MRPVMNEKVMLASLASGDFLSDSDSSIDGIVE